MDGDISPPPGDLSGFPERRLPAGSRLWLAHDPERFPWMCTSTGKGRFDLAGGWGTVHLAEEPLGALVECCLRQEPTLPLDSVRRHVLSLMVTEAPLRLADLTHGRAFAFGLTAEIHSIPDYGPTQDWARALHRAGFDGVAYLLRHDPSRSLRGVARFGEQGERHDWPRAVTTPIPDEVVRQATDRLGVTVLTDASTS